MVILSRHRRSPGGPSDALPSDEGFTLLEVLVALAVLGLSLTVLLAVFTQALDWTHAAQRQLAAIDIAKSLLLQAEVIPASRLADNSGTTASGFEWRVRIQPYGSRSDNSTWPTAVARVSTTVSWKENGRERALSLATLRLVPKDKNP